MSTVRALLWSEAVQDRRHPLHVVLLVLAPLVPVAVHRYVVDLVGAAPTDRVGGDWFAFGALGLVVVTAMDGSLRAGGAALQRLQDQGSIPSLLSAARSWAAVPVAIGAWPAVVHLVAAAVALVLAVLLGADLEPAGLPLAALAVGLAMAATAGLAALAAAVAVLARRGEPLVRLGTLATALLAGTVFPVEVLPVGLRAVSWALPHTHAIRAVRGALQSVPPAQDPSVSVSLAWLAGLGLVVVVVGSMALRGALVVARREGLLGSAA